MTSMNLVTWDEVERLVTRIVQQMGVYRPKEIIAVGRGGLVPARLLMDRLNIKTFRVLNARRYEGQEGGGVRLVPLPPPAYEDGAILLVDDISDKGETLKYITAVMGPKKMMTATLHIKHHTSFQPNFWGMTVADDIWQVYPWDRREHIHE